MHQARIVTGLAVLLVTAVFAGAAAAAQTNYDIGKVGGTELKLPLGARPVAMGEAFVGLADDLNSTAWNAAGLSQLTGYHAGFMHNIYLQETSQEYLAYAQNLFEGAGLGAYLTYMNYGTLEKVNETPAGLPEVVGEFTPSTITFSAGYGQTVMESLALGAAVKFISQNIDTESYSAVAVDVGMLWNVDPSGLKAGLVIQNLGTSLADANLPMLAKVGAAYTLLGTLSTKDTWNFLLDVNVPFGDTNYVSANLGTEYWYDDLVAVRLGYKLKDSGELGGATGLTVGAGVKIDVLNLDYALVSFGDLGLTHQIAIGTSFE